MDSLINLYAKISGMAEIVMDWLPVLGAVGSILTVSGGILARASASTAPAGVLHGLHPTPGESATVMVAIGVIKAHFNHLSNQAQLAGHAATLNAMNTPQSVPPPQPNA